METLSTSLRCFSAALFCMAALGVSMATTPKASADSLTWAFTGDIAGISPSLSGIFNTSQTMSGSFTFEASTPASGFESFFFKQYINPVTALSVEIAGNTWTLSPARDNVIAVDTLAGNFHVITAAVVGPDAAGRQPLTFTLELLGPPPSGNIEAVIPRHPPQLDELTTKLWMLEFIDPVTETAGPSGPLTSLSVVPEPSSFLLLGSGLMVFTAWRWKGCHRKNSG